MAKVVLNGLKGLKKLVCDIVYSACLPLSYSQLVMPTVFLDVSQQQEKEVSVHIRIRVILGFLILWRVQW